MRGVTTDGRLPVPVPEPALVVLVGPSGSGKSTWAAAHFRATETVSSDALRAVVGSGPNDLDASADAFALLDTIVAARAGRGLTTVVDTTGLDAVRRRAWRELARTAGLAAVLVRFVTPVEICRARNRARERPVPAAVLTAQAKAMRVTRGELDLEGWDLMVAVGADDQVRSAPAATPAPMRPGAGAVAATSRDGRPQIVLQLSRFPWGEDPVTWLKAVAGTAQQVGLDGIALMDHLIQIPQVGREWEDLPEPFVTLGLLAGAAPGLRLGTLVSPVSIRTAGLLAKTVATLDVLTGGRAFCGIGAGWWGREHAAYGLPFPPARDRLDLLEATIEAMRALWRPGTGAYSGEWVELPETACYPRPIGPVPVIVGGRKPRLLGIAGRLGDACNLPSDPAVLEPGVALVRAAAAEAGRDPAEVAVTVLDLPVVGRDREDAAQQVERLRGRTAASAYALAHHAGVAADHAERYRALAELGVSTVFVALPGLAGADDLERLAPVVAALR
jgi:alkanesulfonate monooxygenase SsuD/methylene tetrahydromethanopterin reductase-like flavin-dependent oxidoreductase (luciferase family)/predicted kinase